MSFLLRVITASRHKDWHFVGVAVEEGTFKLGETAFVKGCPDRQVKILSTSFVNSLKPMVPRRTTLTVEAPTFPIEDLIGTTLVDRETAFAAGQPTLVSHSKERS